MRVTQRDIAKKLNLSSSLVAGVLNDRQNIWVSEHNRQRILNTAKEMNYRPNAAAKALRSGRTNVVASVFFESPGHQAIVETLAEQLEKIGYDLLVVMVSDQNKAMDRLNNLISRSVCDAMVLWGSEQNTERPALLLESERVPFVVKGHFEDRHPNWCQVDFDHEKMMMKTVEYLVALGHRNIAFIGYNHGLVYEMKLREGFCKGMKACLGVEAPDSFILSCNDELSFPGENVTEFQRSVERLLDVNADMRPTAFAMGTGLRSWHIIEGLLARRGMKIGWDFGDITLAGTGGEDAPLLYGKGYMYKDADLAYLAGVIASQLLPVLLKGEQPTKNIVLSLPTFGRHPSFELPIR